MGLIGIITNKNNEEQYEEELKKLIDLGENIIFFNNDSIENFKNVSFDVILLCYDYTGIIENIGILRKVVSNAKKLIINTDIKENYDVFNELDIDVITYGFNSKATVNFSSNEDEVIMCVQRNIMNMKDKTIEPQDIKINPKNNMKNVYEKHGISILFLIYL